MNRSFFLTQIERRGLHLAAGPQAYLLAMFRVANVMRKPEDETCASADELWDAIAEGYYINGNATLEAAMPIFERTNRSFLVVVNLGGAGEPPEILGALFQVDALRAYNRALAATAAEEHS